MRKTVHHLMIYMLAFGLVLLVISRFFSDRLSDFTLGFLEGVSVVFIICSFLYLCWYIFKGRFLKCDESFQVKGKKHGKGSL